ncbi:MAG: hypothetical protein QOD50_463 [Actinomycetota bacterium]|nr:hypothetical protein [Actinomycetota bacterium]
MYCPVDRGDGDLELLVESNSLQSIEKSNRYGGPVLCLLARFPVKNNSARRAHVEFLVSIVCRAQPRSVLIDGDM